MKREKTIRNILFLGFQCSSSFEFPKHLTFFLWEKQGVPSLPYSLRYPNLVRFQEIYCTTFTSGWIYHCKLMSSCAKTLSSSHCLQEMELLSCTRALLKAFLVPLFLHTSKFSSLLVSSWVIKNGT